MAFRRPGSSSQSHRSVTSGLSRTARLITSTNDPRFTNSSPTVASVPPRRTNEGALIKKVTLTLEEQAALRAEGSQRRVEELQGIPVYDRNVINNSRPGPSAPNNAEDYVEVPLDEFAPGSDDDDEGWKTEAAEPLVDAIVDSANGAAYYVARSTRGWTHSRISRAEKLRRAHAEWATQYDIVTTSYMDWRHSEAWKASLFSTRELETQDVFEVDAIGWTFRDRFFACPNDPSSPNRSLVAAGFLSHSPIKPMRAFSLHLLEQYRLQSLRFPRYGIQPFLKSVCDSFNQPYESALRQQFSDTYDVYLEILRRAEHKVSSALGRTTPNWRVLNSCPCCQHRVPDEPKLQYDLLMAIDGNMSLKRFADPHAADTREFVSDYFIPCDEVDEFATAAVKKKSPSAQEDAGKKPKTAKKGKGKGKGKGKDVVEEHPKKGVKRKGKADPKEKRKGKKQKTETTTEAGGGAEEAGGDGGEDADDEEPEPDEDDDDAAIAKAIPLDDDGDWISKTIDEVSTSKATGTGSVCVERWKANADDSKKGMFSCFRQSGIFLGACRHGMVLFITDMIESGELMKYPLAITAKLNDILAGPRIQGYDIGCAFKKTVNKTNIDNSRIRHCTPAMHGFAHNRPCQHGHHPLYLPGAGLEDFETCERIFSSSNDCARITRHATDFHRHQRIDAHFRQWDADKFEALATFIFNNYRQALLILAEYQEHLGKPEWAGFDELTFARWREEEMEYLNGLKTEPEESTLAVEYVNALETLEEAEKEYEASRSTLPEQTGPTSERSNRKLKPSHKRAMEKVSFWQVNVADLESQLGLYHRWTPTSPEYLRTKEYIRIRKWRLALDHLERLVVQRLFELQKGHVEGTGYNLRTYIAKHLKSRSKTIQAAVTAYNKAARAVGRPVVTFSAVVHYSFLAEFDILREARQDVREKRWAEPRNRRMMDQYFKSVRAKEEIARLNVEIARLLDWIDKQTAAYTAAIAQQENEDPSLADELRHRYEYQQEVWINLKIKLCQTEALNGYSGPLGPVTQQRRDAREEDSDIDEESERVVDNVDRALRAIDDRD